MSIIPTLMPGPQRNVVHRERLAGQAGERRPRVGERVDADAEPGHAVAAGHADQAEQQDEQDLRGLETDQREVRHDDGADEDLENQQELALLDQVGLARLVDQIRHVGHRPVHRQLLHGDVRRHAEQQPEHAHEEARQQDVVTVEPQEVALAAPRDATDV
jgi:hypothetical protein